MSAEILFVFLFSLVFLLIASKLAMPLGLVDRPSQRKHHQGVIPLVGGISVYAGICFALLFTDQTIADSQLYLLCAGVLVLLGAIDDRFDISVKLRVAIQTLVAISMMLFADLYLRSFGYIFGSHETLLGFWGYPLTLLACWAAINSFNMIDGIDGLLGGLSSVAFLSLGLLFYQAGSSQLALFCFAMLSAIVPYLLLNLAILGRRYKVFMGDAGSTLIGFTLIWLLLQGSQSSQPAINPVTALWVLAIPLMDMVVIMYRRLHKGGSPFSADRQHIHHLIMRAGFSSRQACLLITLAAAILATIGVVADLLTVIPQWLMFALFLCMFFFYAYLVKHPWRFARYIKRVKRRYQADKHKPNP